MTLDARLEGAHAAQPELCSLNMGPLIFDFSGAGKRVKEWRQGWERDYVEGSRGRIMYNDNVFIERIMVEVGQAYGTRFEFECYDVGHLYTLAHFADPKLIEPPFLIQGVIGILAGIGADVRNLAHMVTVADGLFGDDYLLSAFAAGRHQMDLCTQSVLLGGHARVGLEDSLFIWQGRAGDEQRTAGRAHPADRRGARARGRDPRRNARAARAQGRRSRQASQEFSKHRYEYWCDGRPACKQRNGRGR